MKNYHKTLVVDSSYTARGIISTERAFVISYKGNAEVLEIYPETFKLVNPQLVINKPSIIRIHRYVKQAIHKIPLTRENIYRRDHFKCVYCGDDERETLTLDHVQPRSKGGVDAWNNLVTACRRCNIEKSDLTLQEYGKSIAEPKKPHFIALLRAAHYIPKEWEPYLFS